MRYKYLSTVGKFKYISGDNMIYDYRNRNRYIKHCQKWGTTTLHKKDIAELIDLPRGKDLKVTWDSDKKTITVSQL